MHNTHSNNQLLLIKIFMTIWYIIEIEVTPKLINLFEPGIVQTGMNSKPSQEILCVEQIPLT